jgi:hypothetical protein
MYMRAQKRKRAQWQKASLRAVYIRKVCMLCIFCELNFDCVTKEPRARSLTAQIANRKVFLEYTHTSYCETERKLWCKVGERTPPPLLRDVMRLRCVYLHTHSPEVRGFVATSLNVSGLVAFEIKNTSANRRLSTTSQFLLLQLVTWVCNARRDAVNFCIHNFNLV